MRFHDLVNNHGVENIIILFPCSKIEVNFPGLPVGLAGDDYSLIPCQIMTDRDWPLSEATKVSLKPMVPGYGIERTYQMDVMSLINEGTAHLYIRRITK